MAILGTLNTKRLIIYGQLLVLFSAFSSILWQIHGLFGERGLVPVGPMLECEEESVFQCRLPLLRAVCFSMDLSPGVGLQFLAIIGLSTTVLALTNCIRPNILTFLVLYFIYRTIYEAGGVFMYFSGDHLLLESTISVAILAWFEDGPADAIALYGIIVLLVRVIFMNGVTKLLSKSPEWWSLTAMDYHFQSLPVPTPFAWYGHHLPSTVKQVISLLTLYGEIVLPPFFLIPLIHVRYAMFFSQVLLLTLTVFTGNFGVFNYNIFVLLISLLARPQISVAGASVLSFAVFTKIAHDIFYRFPWKNTPANGSTALSLGITFEQFQALLVNYINLIVFLVPIICFFVAIYVINGMSNWQNKLRKIIHLGFVLGTTSLLLCYGMVPLNRLDQKLAEKTIKDPSIMHYYKIANSWNLANAYGSYKQTAGAHGRPEIVIQGSHKVDGPWMEITFIAKPGKLWTRPKFMALHHPRLDWLMHLAAEGTYQQNPFFLSLVHHLMQNTTEVVNLIENYPFKNRSEPMRFVRASLYMYHYTQMGQKDNYWTRDFQEEYMPTFNKGNPALATYLKDHKLLTKSKATYTNGPFGRSLKRFHNSYTTSFDSYFMMTIAMIALVVAIACGHLGGDLL